jgi:hypothetical protein
MILDPTHWPIWLYFLAVSVGALIGMVGVFSLGLALGLMNCLEKTNDSTIEN